MTNHDSSSAQPRRGDFTLAGLAALAVLCLALAAPAALDAATARGRITVQAFESTGVSQYSLSFPFEAAAQGRQWRVQVDYGKSYREVCGSDGERTCSILFPSPTQLRRDLGDTASRLLRPASIVPGGHPAVSEPTTRVLWLAFGSAAVLGSAAPALPGLWGMGFRDPAYHAVSLADIKFLTSPDGLPSSLDFVIAPEPLNGWTNLPYLSAKVAPGEVRKAMRQAAEFTGRTVARYRVIQSTNVQGAALPLEFDFTVFAPGGAGNWLPMQTFSGVVDSLSAEGPARFLPEPQGPIGVTDYRFFDRATGVDSVYYATSNRVWLPSSDATLLALFETSKRNRAASLPRLDGTGRQRVAVVVALVFLAAVPLFLLRRRKRPTPGPG